MQDQQPKLHVVLSSSHDDQKRDLLEKLPRHIGIVMDGNGRWSRAKSIPVVMGHKRGAEVARDIIDACADLNVGYLTLYAFSSENWKRPLEEVDSLMGLLRWYLNHEAEKLHQKNIRLKVIGDRTSLAKDILQMIERVEKKTAENTGLCLVMALSYGGRDELVRAFKTMIDDFEDHKFSRDGIDESLIASYLDTKNIPDPDLIIRTSGEQRLSNFLTYQAAYSEFFFTKTLWPDFSKEHLYDAIDDYLSRQRRFGKSGDQCSDKIAV